MFIGNKNKKWFGMMVAIVVCLALEGVAQADWYEKAKLLASDGAAIDLFGGSVSISGDYAIVGAIYADGNEPSSGSAYIFKRSGTDWYQQAKLTASDGAAGDLFGVSVSISGDYAIVGALGDTHKGTNSGSAYIFEKPVGGWVNANETAKLTASDGAAYDCFGVSVSINGDYGIVGAHSGEGIVADCGSAYIFEKPVGGWINANETAKLTASDGAYYDQFGLSVSISGDYAIVGARNSDGIVADCGSSYIFEKPVGGWVNANETAKLTASDGAAYDYFGESVSISGDYSIVGAYRGDGIVDNSGSAYIFEKPVGGWGNATETAKLTASDGAGGEEFGKSVSISSDYAIVGATLGHGIAVYCGSAYTFKRNGTNWVELGKLIASDGAYSDEFGLSVSISDDDVIVGAPYNDEKGTDSGSAYIFKLLGEVRGTKWHDIDGDCIHDPGEKGLQGWNIYIDANGNGQWDAGEPNGFTDANGAYVITDLQVGTYTVAEEGQAGWKQTFPGGGGTHGPVTLGHGELVENLNFGNLADWKNLFKLTADDGSAGDAFGVSVSINGDHLIVGATMGDGILADSGSAYIFNRNEGSWVQQAKLTASDGATYNYFGRSPCITDDYAVIGAVGDDDKGTWSGSAYIFEKPVAGWVDTTETVKLLASDGAAYDRFGWVVSISGDYVIVGAYIDDNKNGIDAGSAYIFKRDGISWTQQAKLTASDGSAYDYFGHSVSISGDYAIVGAYIDDNAKGINAGSAYIFKRNEESWVEQAKLTASDGAASDGFGFSASISGDYAIVGASVGDGIVANSGSAYIFKRKEESWLQQAKLTASDGAAYDYFGESVSISEDYVIVGVYADDSKIGSVYIFENAGGGWVDATETVKLTAPDGAAEDRFGWSVSISGSDVIVGAVFDDDKGSDSGSAYMFRKDCPDWLTADVNGDCLVDFVDFAILARQWLQYGY